MHAAFRPKLGAKIREGYSAGTFRMDAIARLTAVIAPLTRSLAALATGSAIVEES